ncbi:MAG: secE [Solirubrobacterales bacterium]|nr:secE [Solirubrobacterales bacterium]
MARDRQRAKQRRARRAQQNPGPTPSEPRRENVPGELQHASGEVDEFEAALVAGADGDVVPTDPEPVDTPDVEGEPGEHPEDLSPEEFDDLEEEVDARAERPAAASSGAATPARRAAAAPGAPTKSGAGRLVGFLRASWAELQRVQWPDRRQVGQATAVVVGFVVVAGAYLGLADQIAQKLVDFIL